MVCSGDLTGTAANNRMDLALDNINPFKDKIFSSSVGIMNTGAKMLARYSMMNIPDTYNHI